MSTTDRDDVVRFVPGEGSAVVGHGFVALVDADPRSDMVKTLVRWGQTNVEFVELIDELAARGVRDLPPFAVVTADNGSCTAIVRGGMVVVFKLDGGRGDVTLNGQGVASWVEHHEVGVGSVLLHLTGDLSELGVFEVAGGLVPASRVSWERRSEAVPAPIGSADPVLPRSRPERDEAVVEESVAAVVDELVAAGNDVPAETSIDAQADAPDSAPTGPDEEGATIQFTPDAADAADTPDAADAERPVPIDDAASPAPAEDHDGSDDYDHLFGATLYRPVSAAGIHAVEPATDDAAGAASPDPAGLIAGIPGAPAVASATGPDIPADHGDHDGMTITLAELQQLQGSESTVAAPPAGGASPGDSSHLPSVIANMVHAVQCTSGHYNPPSATLCRVCGVEIPQQSHVTVPRPVLGRLRFSDGTEVAVTRPMLLGRLPKADGPVSGELPELVALASPTKELSGTHLEIRIEGWQVLVVDRQSTNGSTVGLPNRAPVRLHPGEPFPVVPGTVVDLAGEISFVFEVVA